MSAAAEGLIAALADDPAARLKWRVMGMLGICPVSLRALLLTKRRAVEFDAEKAKTPDAGAADNPRFDMARFRALAEGRTI